MDSNPPPTFRRAQRGMKPKTIVFWGREDLLSSSVELLLTAQKEWHVINVTNEGGAETLMETLEKISSDVVIIHLEDRVRNSTLPSILLKNYPHLRVITVNPKDTLVEVYSKQCIVINSASDLISVIEADTVNSIEQSR